MLKHAHSGLRWVVLILLVLAVVNALIKWLGRKNYTSSDGRLDKGAMLMVHIQILIGLVLYFISPKVVFSGEAMKEALTRFFTVEHITMMIVAAVFITIGHARKKRRTSDVAKFKTVFWFYLIGLILILSSIPWPFQGYGTAWF